MTEPSNKDKSEKPKPQKGNEGSPQEPPSPAKSENTAEFSKKKKQ